MLLAIANKPIFSYKKNIVKLLTIKGRFMYVKTVVLFLLVGVFSLHFSSTECSQRDLSSHLKAKKYAENHASAKNCTFSYPKEWSVVIDDTLPEVVEVMVKGGGEYELPPSLNLATEHVSLSQKEYVHNVLQLHKARNSHNVKVLGTIQTFSSPATLIEYQTKSGWGDVRMIQAIIVETETAYILTAAALKEEFPQFYKEFFSSIQSLKINSELFTAVEYDIKKQLQNRYDMLYLGWRESYDYYKRTHHDLSSDKLKELAFESPAFQEEHWKSFCSVLVEECPEMGAEWHEDVLFKIHKDLFSIQ
jgi:hypothetical protein